jgi:CarD family transcriptional regulator
VRRTSARAFAGCRRSTSWTATCRPETTRPAGRVTETPGQPGHRRRRHTISETTTEVELDEDLEITREVEHIDYKVGDHVVYPHHGAGKVLKKEMKDILGEKREYLTIKILHNDMTVMVPCENAGRAGLRRVIDEGTVKKVLAVLQDDVSDMPKNWNRRFKHNRDKIKTGDIYELAEVVRNLAIREAEKGLSTGEKQMFTRAKKILASELMYALEMGEEEAEQHLDDLLTESANGKVAVAAGAD